MLLNPEYLPNNISQELKEYLGFSKKFGLDVHPITTKLNKIGFKLITKLDNNKNVNYGMVLAYNTSLVSL